MIDQYDEDESYTNLLTHSYFSKLNAHSISIEGKGT
jgi:hypothetical protein